MNRLSLCFIRSFIFALSAGIVLAISFYFIK